MCVSVIPLLEAIRQKVQDWFSHRSLAALYLKSVLTPWAEEEVQKQIEFVRIMTVS